MTPRGQKPSSAFRTSPVADARTALRAAPGAARLPVRILLADDHRLVRQGLRALLEAEPDFRLVGESDDGLDVLRKVDSLKPDVVVLDLMMPGINGIEVTRQLRVAAPRTRVVILSMHADEPYVFEALRHGAAAYILKQAQAGELVRGVREAMAGRRYLSAPLSEETLEAYARKTRDGRLDLYETLTTREREVLELAAQGHTNTEIAAELFIGRRTVESHRAHVMEKLDLRNQAQLVQFAMRRGILPRAE
jgi:two-component system response regulator NreC